MTLLTICQNAADEVGVTRPVTVVASTAPDTQKLYRYANKIGKALMQAAPWSILRAEHTFTSVASEVQTSILPSDFDRFVVDTFWDRTQQVMFSGPTTPAQWQALKALPYTDTYRPKFTTRAGNVLILPTWAAGDTLAFEYVSNLWALSSGGTGQSSFLADTDTAKLNEELITYGVIFEFLDQAGQPSGKAGAAFRDMFDALLKNDQPASGVVAVADIFTSSASRPYTGIPPTNGGYPWW